MIVEDGTGKGFKQGVNSSNQALVRSTTHTDQEAAVEAGRAYNINTGDVTLTGSTAMLYLKNNEDQDFFIEAFAVGLGTGTAADIGLVTLHRGPTGGTIITDSNTSGLMNQNRNFGSSEVLTADVFKATATGATVSGGNKIAQFYMGLNSRLFADIDFTLPKGTAIAIEVNPNLASGNAICYVAIIGHTEESE